MWNCREMWPMRGTDRRVLSDMQSLGIQTIKDLETKSKKREHFKMMTEARIL